MSNRKITKFLEAQRADLQTLYFCALRQTMFDNRACLRPADLSAIAEAEAGAIWAYFRRPSPAYARRRGCDLCQVGLAKTTLRSLDSETRQYFCVQLPESLRAKAIDLLEAYHRERLQGFIQTYQTIYRAENERLYRAAGKVFVQVEADAARLCAILSTLDAPIPEVAQSFMPTGEPGAAADPAAGRSLEEMLSGREGEVLQLLAQGCTNLQIAETLCITERTVRFHVGSILKKLGAKNRTEAVALALKNGWKGVKTGV